MKLKFFLFVIAYMGSVANAQAQGKAYFNQTDIGFMLGRVAGWGDQYESRLNFSFSTFHGVRMLPSHVVGFSAGIDTYPGMTMVPLALGWRGFREKGKKYTWFGGVDVGGGSTMLQKNVRNEWSESWYDGGIYFSPSLGVRKDTKRRKHSFVWSLGYKRQEASFYEGYFDFTGIQPHFNSSLPPGFSSVRKESIVFNSFFFRWGLMF